MSSSIGTSELGHVQYRKTFKQLGLIVISAGLALFAIFGLANWAELSAAHHAVQHLLLFLGGVGIGSSVISSIKRGK